MSLARASLVVAFAAALSGCGDDGADSAAPSKPAYIAQADAICTRGNAALQRAAAKFFGDSANPTPAQERDYVAKIFVPNIERQLAELRKLQAPKGDEERVRAVWDASASGLEEIKARHGPPGPPPAEIKKAQALAVAYGFKVCGTT